MKVKNIFRVAVFAGLMAMTAPAMANVTDSDPVQPATTENAKEVRAQQMLQRLEEIKSMDKSQLTRDEKKALRREVKDMKKEARRDEIKGIYLSIGAVIIIVLLLILIL